MESCPSQLRTGLRAYEAMPYRTTTCPMWAGPGLIICDVLVSFVLCCLCGCWSDSNPIWRKRGLPEDGQSNGSETLTGINTLRQNIVKAL